MNKITLIGIVAMLIGAILVIVGLLNVPIMSVIMILLGGCLGFAGYKVYENRKPKNLYYG